MVFKIQFPNFPKNSSLPFIGLQKARKNDWRFGNFCCKLTSNLTLTGLYAGMGLGPGVFNLFLNPDGFISLTKGVLFLCALSFDRYLAVCCPIKARKIRNKKEPLKIFSQNHMDNAKFYHAYHLMYIICDIYAQFICCILYATYHMH